MYLPKREYKMFKTNEYFEGKVISIAYESETNLASVGVMAPGSYVFSTAAKEKMTVITGALEIHMPDTSESTTYNAGESFEVAADSSLNVHALSQLIYSYKVVLCLYLCRDTKRGF